MFPEVSEQPKPGLYEMGQSINRFNGRHSAAVDMHDFARHATFLCSGSICLSTRMFVVLSARIVAWIDVVEA
jgi:hypothetical protein